MPADAPPPGWVSHSGVLEPAPRVGDYAARGQVVKGVCRANGCFRRVELDPKELCGQGLGAITMDQVKRLYRCARLDGCSIDYHNEPPAARLRLDQFVGLPNVRVRLRCRRAGCKFFRVWRVEEMIAGLTKRQQGGSHTEIDALGPMMTSACPLCHRTNWGAEILWADTSTVGWRTMGERYFEGVQAR